MEMIIYSNYFYSVLMAFLFTFLIFKISRTPINYSVSNLPPGPRKLPFIGNLHLLFGKLPHYCFRDLANIYGPIIHLQLGEISTVVVSSPKIVREIIQNHDSNFADRPRIYAAKSITYDFSDIGFSKCDDRWRQLRKICNLELLSHKRIQSFRLIRNEEYSSLVRNISSRSGSPIYIGEMLYSSSFHIISRAAFGRKSKHQEAFIDRMKQIMYLLAGFSPVDLFPSIKILHLVNAMRPTLKRLHREVDKILETTIRGHKINVTSQIVEVEDILSVMLNLQDKAELKVPLTDAVIKAVILDLFLGGGETSTIVVEWAMSELLKEPRVMEKVQAEVRQVFAPMGKVEEENLHQLKYLNCVIKETFRLHPPAPMLLPRESREKCMISGYEIPAKTRLIVNTWAMGRDANYWTEPEKFYPERFFEREVGGVDYELIPFGVGKRKCPGESFGLLNSELMLANLLYHFDWKFPGGEKPQDLDMTEIFLTASKRKNDLLLIPVPHHVVPA